MMKDFIYTGKDKELKNNRDLGLSLSIPFRNFRDIIDRSEKYRDEWFEFKTQKYIEYVNAQLDYRKEELK
jgi:hypothetical protein